MTDVEVRVCGIPAIARVTYYFKQEPLGPSADSDMDCCGYTDVEFQICDRRGRPAGWLERKMTSSDQDDVYLAVVEALEE